MRRRISALFLAMIFAAFTAPSLAHATFQIDTNPTVVEGTKLFLDNGSNTTGITGHVGSQTGPKINITTDAAVDVVGSGWATIQNVNSNDLLTTLTFVPDASNTDHYGDFSLRGQLESAGDVFLEVTANDGTTQTFNLGTFNANTNFERVGIISYDGEWLTQLVLSTADGFSQVKQMEFSLQEAAPVPEPGTLLLLGAGFFGLAVFGKRRSAHSL